MKYFKNAFIKIKRDVINFTCVKLDIYRNLEKKINYNIILFVI